MSYDTESIIWVSFMTLRVLFTFDDTLFDDALRNSKQQNPNTLLENEDPLTHLFPMHPFSVL